METFQLNYYIRILFVTLFIYIFHFPVVELLLITFKVHVNKFA